jgi:hypothetical protein
MQNEFLLVSEWTRGAGQKTNGNTIWTLALPLSFDVAAAAGIYT